MLAETVVALLIVMLAMLFGLALLIEHPRLLARLERQRQAYDSIEAVLEGTRAGVLPIRLGLVDMGDGLSVEVSETETPGLFEIEVTARYTLQAQEYERKVSTATWRP